MQAMEKLKAQGVVPTENNGMLVNQRVRIDEVPLIYKGHRIL